MDQLSSVRAEIKSWERSFKAQNGHDPSIQDIKALPPIAEKYKLYKKLSKAASVSISDATSATKRANTPSTPPRSGHAPFIHSAAAVEPTAPLAGFNPFSPSKAKYSAGRPSGRGDTRRGITSNPFATPVKGKSKGKGKAQTRIANDEDPFPLIQSSQPSQQQHASSSGAQPVHSTATNSSTGHIPQQHVPHEPTSAVTRARKRLRGEPVSPSPAKRARTLPFDSLSLISSSAGRFPSHFDDDSDDEDGDEGAADSSFVDDSPVKAPAGGKAFRLLFEDALPVGAKTARLKSRPKDIKGKGAAKGGDETLDWVLGPNLLDGGTKGTNGVPTSTVAKTIDAKPKFKRATSSRLTLKDSKSASSLKGRASNGHGDLTLPASRPPPNPLNGEGMKRTSSKRALSPAPPESPDPAHDEPSPRSNGVNVKDKGKGKAKEQSKTLGRKKARVEVTQGHDGAGEDEDSRSSEEDARVKLVPFSRTRRPLADVDSDLDDDPLLNDRHENDIADPAEDGSTFEVALPDTLRRVLAISPQGDGKEERRVLQGLLYDRRGSRYDGGEIWGVGEADEIGVGEGDEPEKAHAGEDEDDWEGEGIPWEVGELS